MRNLRNLYNAFFDAWNGFFFGHVSSFNIGVFRIFFGLNLLVMYTVRFLDWKFYYTDLGFVPTADSIEILPEFYRPSFTWFPNTPQLSFILYCGFLFSLIALIVGIRGRLAALVAFVLHLAFMQRNYAIVYGADLISTFFLFGLIWTDNSRELSFDSWLNSRHRFPVITPVSDLFNTVGLRLMQIQLCIIYGYTGMEKLKGSAWWDGTAVWSVLGNRQIMMINTSWLRHVPLLVAAMTMGTVLFEVYFPVLVWMKPVRKWLLLFGVVLHISIAFTVGLFFFSFAMMSTYLLFIDSDQLRYSFRGLKEKLGLRTSYTESLDDRFGDSNPIARR